MSKLISVILAVLLMATSAPATSRPDLEQPRFKSEVIAYVKPIQTIPAVLDSLPSFFKARNFGLEEQYLTIEILAKRYSLDCGTASLSPNHRIALMRSNYELRAYLREEIAHTTELQGVIIRQLGADVHSTSAMSSAMSSELAQLTTTVSGLDLRLTAAEAEIDTLSAGLVAVQKAVEQNGFNIQAAFSVLRHAEVGKNPNKDAQRLISRYGQQRN